LALQHGKTQIRRLTNGHQKSSGHVIEDVILRFKVFKSMIGQVVVTGRWWEDNVALIFQTGSHLRCIHMTMIEKLWRIFHKLEVVMKQSHCFVEVFTTAYEENVKHNIDEASRDQI
jgi:hypothetical protein